MNKVTPENIDYPPQGVCVLVGTNESGIHGAGIAKHAMDHWGLPLGFGFGPAGQCFALPTKDWEVKTLPLEKIEFYVQRYLTWTQMIRTSKWKHYVTRIGCGLAGYTPEEIAPMFYSCLGKRNIALPQDFIDVINDPTSWKYSPIKVQEDEIERLRNSPLL